MYSQIKDIKLAMKIITMESSELGLYHCEYLYDPHE